MSAALDVASAAGPGIGAGLGFWGGFRFVRWIVEFIYKRSDIRNARLVAREKDIEAKFNARLRHVEAELARYREATMLLVNALAAENPANKALAAAARILREVVPRSSLELDELVERLSTTPMPGMGE